QHAARERPGAPQQRGRRRQAELRRVGRAEPGQGARAAAAGAAEHDRRQGDPAPVRRVLSDGVGARGEDGTVLAAGLAKQPFILLFLVVAAGYALSRLKVRGIGLGATASTLTIALATSLIAALRGTKIAIPEFASALFFNLFMFAVGM